DAGLGELLVEDEVLHRAQARTAVLLRPGGRHPGAFHERLPPRLQPLARRLRPPGELAAVCLDGLAVLVTVLTDELAHLLAKGGLLRRVTQIHGHSSWRGITGAGRHILRGHTCSLHGTGGEHAGHRKSSRSRDPRTVV